jgi:PAS fold
MEPGGVQRPPDSLGVFADFTWVARFDGKVFLLESVSEGFTRATGYTLDELNSTGGPSFAVHPDDLFLVLQSLERLVSGKPDSNEVRVIDKSVNPSRRAAVHV